MSYAFCYDNHAHIDENQELNENTYVLSPRPGITRNAGPNTLESAADQVEFARKHDAGALPEG